MATFVLVHGAGDSGWAWHLLEGELRARGHRTVAPDLPSGDPDCGFDEYADAVVRAVGPLAGHREVVVVGHSFGGFTAPLVADRIGASQLVLLAAMVPAPGESPNDWWAATGYAAASRSQAARDGGLTGSDDPMVCFYNGVPPEVAHAAEAHALPQSERPMSEPWPMDAWPSVPTRFLLCQDDRFFPPDFLRTLCHDRLGITPTEIPGGHCLMLANPTTLADALLLSDAPDTPPRM